MMRWKSIQATVPESFMEDVPVWFWHLGSFSIIIKYFFSWDLRRT